MEYDVNVVKNVLTRVFMKLRDMLRNNPKDQTLVADVSTYEYMLDFMNDGIYDKVRSSWNRLDTAAREYAFDYANDDEKDEIAAFFGVSRLK